MAVVYSDEEAQRLKEARARRMALPSMVVVQQSQPGQHDEPVILWSRVCGHRVRHDVNRHCGCIA